MDTSESEHSRSGEESADDDEWVHPMFIARKRNSRKEGQSGSETHSLDTDGGESVNRESSVETACSLKENLTAAVCCSCSKASSCKTMKCECRSSGGSCTAQCGCSSLKCSNREDQKVNIGQQESGSNKNGMLSDEVEHGHNLTSQGVTLLQSALAERPTEQPEENGAQRKPLADIGNTAVCCVLTAFCSAMSFRNISLILKLNLLQGKSNAPRPIQRKKWRKSTIQLVPATPASAPAEDAVQPEKVGSNAVDNAETGKKAESSSTVEASIPLKLPRAMRSASSNGGNLLRVRNSEHGEEPVVRKDSGEPARRSPLRRPKKSEEKENFGL